LTFPLGASVYFIFLFINPLSFPPISGANDSDHAISVGKSHRHNHTGDFYEAVISFLVTTMFHIL
jgi:hypothetical protein